MQLRNDAEVIAAYSCYILFTLMTVGVSNTCSQASAAHCTAAGLNNINITYHDLPAAIDAHVEILSN